MIEDSKNMMDKKMNSKDLEGKTLICNPIGFIHSPYKDRNDTPKNGYKICRS